MSGQILFCRKNYVDLDKPNPIITITDSVATSTGQDSVAFLRNRNNLSGWVTTGSDDTADTEILAYTGDILPIDFIELVRHNFKDYLIEYSDDGTNYYTYVNVTDNTDTTNIHMLDTPINANRIKITVYATQTADADKEMRQLIITQKKYQFEGWPVIKRPVHSKNRQVNPMLSGKVNIIDKRGGFSCDLEIKLSTSDNDLTMHESLYEQREGLLLLLSGAVESQFLTQRKGYRDEDIVLVKPIDEYTNPYSDGVYRNGIKIKIRLAESVY